VKRDIVSLPRERFCLSPTRWPLLPSGTRAPAPLPPACSR